MRVYHPWAALLAEADRLGLRVVAKLPTVREAREEHQALLDEAQAINNLAEKEDRALTDDESARWSELMEADTGLVAKAEAKLEAAEKLGEERKRLAMQRRKNATSIGFDPDAGGEINDASDRSYSNHFPAAHARSIGRLTCFHGKDADRDAYLSGMWLMAASAQALGGRNEHAEQEIAKAGLQVVRNTGTIGTDSQGGFLTPTPITAAFFERREQVSVMRKLAERHLMVANTLEVPKLISGPAVTYPGEATAPAPSDQEWGSDTLTAVKRMVLSKLSYELKDDAVINVVDQWVSRSGYELGLQDDREAILGDGTPTYGGETGVLAALGTAGILNGGAGFNDMTLAHHTAVMGILPSEFFGMPYWLCSTAYYYGVMHRLMVEAGGSSAADIRDTGGLPMFLNYPVVITDRMPQTAASGQIACLFGTFSDAIYLGQRREMVFAMSEHSGFEEDVVTLKATHRQDWLVHNGGDASEAGAYVGLRFA